MTEPVHLFDIASSLSGPLQSWSPNTIKTRILLNYRRILYTQTFISYPDIAPLSLTLGLPPLPNRLNVPWHKPFLLPAIVHSSCPAECNALADSWEIALHLERTFPASKGHPSIFPNGQSSHALALSVQRLVGINVIDACYDLVCGGVQSILDPRGCAYFRRTRTASEGGIAPEDLAGSPEEQEKKWLRFKRALQVFLEMLRGLDGRGGPFLEGKQFGYADAVLVGVFVWFHRCERNGWERIMRLGNGEFRVLWEACEGWVDGQGEERAWEWEGKGGVPEFEGE